MEIELPHKLLLLRLVDLPLPSFVLPSLLISRQVIDDHVGHWVRRLQRTCTHCGYRPRRMIERFTSSLVANVVERNAPTSCYLMMLSDPIVSAIGKCSRQKPWMHVADALVGTTVDRRPRSAF